MSSMLVSIIIPVYNVQDYILECLESVASQTYTGSMECILVDDCGQDDSMKIVEDYLSSYRGGVVFRVINHKRNRGLSAARNTGIRESNGKWLFFLDSDDRIIKDCIESMVFVANRFPTIELVCAGAKATASGYEWMEIENRDVPDYCDNQAWINSAILKRNVFLMTAWNKLIRRDFVIRNDLYFKEDAICEDEMWNFSLSKYVSSIAVCKRNTYVYNIRPNSLITNRDSLSKHFLDVITYFVDNIGGQYRENEILATFSMFQIGMSQCMIPEQFADYKKQIKRFVLKTPMEKQWSLGLFFFLPDWLKRRFGINSFLLNRIGSL